MRSCPEKPPTSLPFPPPPFSPAAFLGYAVFSVCVIIFLIFYVAPQVERYRGCCRLCSVSLHSREGASVSVTPHAARAVICPAICCLGTTPCASALMAPPCLSGRALLGL